MCFSKDWKEAYIFPKFPELHQFGNYIQPSGGPGNLGMRLPLPSSVDVATPSLCQYSPVLIRSMIPLLSQHWGEEGDSLITSPGGSKV